MSRPLAPDSARPVAPQFYVTPTQRLGLRSLFPAFVLATACLCAVRYALNRAGHSHVPGAKGFANSSAQDDTDDPNQVDTIYLGGPDQAPTSTRPASHPSTVHPFVTIQLPRSGDQTGQIPDTPAGHLLYNWLAAFNSKNPASAAEALPTPALPAAEAAEVELREQTGGFTLVSAREIQPGLLVFRVQDQTLAATEALGTLQLRPDTIPPSIASFSLRAIPAPTAKPHAAS